MPIEIKPQTVNNIEDRLGTSRKINFSISVSKKITNKERIFLFQQIQLLLQTGTPLYAGLNALQKQIEKPAVKELISDLINTIDEGKSFSYALSKFPDVFSSTQINLISASEEGGFMAQVLQQILDMEERREKLRNTLISAISYPGFLAFFSFAVVAFILVVVFPKFAELFAKIHDTLPATTKSLMWMSDALINHWMIVFSLFSGLLISLIYFVRSESGVMIIDKMKLTFPVIKNIFAQVYLVQSLRVMSLSLGNGVSVMDTLSDCKNTVQNRLYQKFLTEVEIKVQEGSGVSSGFSEAEFIPPLVKQMITTGEETGNLPIVMGKVADHYEAELLKYLQTLSKLAEPIMLLVMGGLVGIIVSSLILPIFSLSRAVH
ncbi:MAG: type II secretion system F family protein [Gammaproteobacteria bacterium]